MKISRKINMLIANIYSVLYYMENWVYCRLPCQAKTWFYYTFSRYGDNLRLLLQIHLENLCDFETKVQFKGLSF